ncbi:gamma-glutamyl phosphate reductase [candidate division BRC1 bacterium SM23_51]|nr:MAG: gamma-glutamyl phosphate reductase [candidate division BRC1 bacterium SM23_51]
MSPEDRSPEPEMLAKSIAQKAKAAAGRLACLQTGIKDAALLAMADVLEARRADLAEANARDLEAAREAALSSALIDRLTLNDKRIGGMIESLRKVASLDDPVGEIWDVRVRPNGLTVGRMRVPFGVIAIIYESRPNVTCDAAALCVKSGNAVILRGGKEAIHSNRAIVEIMETAGREAGLPDNAIQLVPTTDRAAVGALLRLSQFIDLVIPRGGKSLIETVVRESTIPVIKHYDGNCFVYVDDRADLEMALAIVVNAKTQRPGVCNAMETLLIHEAVLERFLPRAVEALRVKGVEIRACDRCRAVVPDLLVACEEDWRTEYLDLILAVRAVGSPEAAIEFVNTYGSHHTDAIVTGDYKRALDFLRAVDSSCVLVNASTRFSDGGQFGMGCEIGISTDKLHARGPMGLRELTTSKFVVLGSGQLRS